MLIAYVTSDEVNQNLALQLADACGQTLCALSPSDAPPDAQFDAAVYDWDSLPVRWQKAALAGLRSGPAPEQLVIHSYNLQDDCVEGLQRQGIAVYRSLQAEIFRQLARAARPRAHAAAASRKRHPDSEELSPVGG